MKVISVIYMSRRNFWCVTRGDSWHLNFQLQKVDWEPSGRQNWGKMMEFWKILYIHFIRDPKGITYVRLILKIESDAKMAVPNGVSKTQVLSDWELHCTVSFDPTIWAEIINFALWRMNFLILNTKSFKHNSTPAIIVRMSKIVAGKAFPVAVILAPIWCQKWISGWLNYQFENHCISVW